MKRTPLQRHVDDMRSVLESIKRDPVRYGVPRSMFEKSIDYIEELSKKVESLEHENKMLRAGPRDAIDM